MLLSVDSKCLDFLATILVMPIAFSVKLLSWLGVVQYRLVFLDFHAIRKRSRPRLGIPFDAACLACAEKLSDSSIITPNCLIVLVGCTVDDFVLLSIVKVGSMSKAFVLFLLLSGRQLTSSDLLVAKDSPTLAACSKHTSVSIFRAGIVPSGLVPVGILSPFLIWHHKYH
jgi:hypothetical protein